MNGLVRYLPLAITQSDDNSGCVGAVTADGRWFRPQPITARDVKGMEAVYRYHRWYESEYVPALEADARPEDHDCVGKVREAGAGPGGNAWRDFLSSLAERSATVALSGRRSLALIRPRIHRVYLKPSTRKRIFLRMEFSDESGEVFDWIVPEVEFRSAATPHMAAGSNDNGWTKRFVGFASQAEVFLTLGLTKPNDRFPGKFGGCHPLVVGIHTIPDYHEVMSEEVKNA